MLQKVSKSALVVFLLNGTYLLGNVEECPLLRPLIVAKLVSEPVGQHSLAHRFIHRDSAVLR